MKLFVCFGGAAPLADDEAVAAEAARLRGKRAGRMPSSFRWRRFFLGKLQGKKKKPSLPPPVAEAMKRGKDMDASGGGVFSTFAASSSSLSSSSSSRLSSTSSSLCSYYSSSPSTPARSFAAASCSLSLTASGSGALSPAPPPARRHGKASSTTSPAAGAAAVVLCLLLVGFCGWVGATLLTPTALYLFPLRWLAKAHSDEQASNRAWASD